MNYLNKPIYPILAFASVLSFSTACSPSEDSFDSVETIASPAVAAKAEGADEALEVEVQESPFFEPDLTVTILTLDFPPRAALWGGSEEAFIETDGKHLNGVMVEIANLGNTIALASRVEFEIGDHYCPDLDPAFVSCLPRQ